MVLEVVKREVSSQMNFPFTETEGRVNPDELIELDGLIEQTWRDLDGRVPRARVRQVAIEVAAEFHDATVTTFIPIFIRRRTRERLEEKIR